MKDITNSYQVFILGNQYTLISDEGAEKVEELSNKVDLLMQEIAEKTECKDVRRIAVLAALKLMHRLQELETNLQKKDHEESQLINYINQQLSSLST